MNQIRALVWKILKILCENQINELRYIFDVYAENSCRFIKNLKLYPLSRLYDKMRRITHNFTVIKKEIWQANRNLRFTCLGCFANDAKPLFQLISHEGVVTFIYVVLVSYPCNKHCGNVFEISFQRAALLIMFLVQLFPSFDLTTALTPSRFVLLQERILLSVQDFNETNIDLEEVYKSV